MSSGCVYTHSLCQYGARMASVGPQNFGFMETTDFKTFRHLGHFGDGPTKRANFSEQKHGAVTQITEAEAQRLEEYWK